jgi:hypothetical protein
MTDKKPDSLKTRCKGAILEGRVGATFTASELGDAIGEIRQPVSLILAELCVRSHVQRVAQGVYSRPPVKVWRCIECDELNLQREWCVECGGDRVPAAINEGAAA